LEASNLLQITKIEVINPIKWMNIRRNELKSVATPSSKTINGIDNKAIGIDIEDDRQQKASLILKDVKYRIYADLVFDQTKDPNSDYAKYSSMFERRASKGQCFNQPYLGAREFSCEFKFISEESLGVQLKPIDLNKELGWMLYDMDYSDSENIKPKFFNPEIRQGVVNVPAWSSEEVRG
jgi:CRISPR-associated protein Cas5d